MGDQKDIDIFDNELLEAAIYEAFHQHDGHITIYRFTTGWKVCFGTPDVTLEERQTLQELPGYMSLEEALRLVVDDGGDQ